MKVFINSIVFASLVACTVAPAQASVWDFTKKVAAAGYENAKSATKAIGNFLMHPKIIGVTLLAASAVSAKSAIEATQASTSFEAATTDLPLILRISQAIMPDPFFVSQIVQSKGNIAALKALANVCYAASAGFGIAGLYNISK